MSLDVESDLSVPVSCLEFGDSLMQARLLSVDSYPMFHSESRLEQEHARCAYKIHNSANYRRPSRVVLEARRLGSGSPLTRQKALMLGMRRKQGRPRDINYNATSPLVVPLLLALF
jgi:hypothetical protein